MNSTRVRCFAGKHKIMQKDSGKNKRSSVEKKEKKEVVQVWCNLQVGKYTKCLRETLKQESNSLYVEEKVLNFCGSVL